MKRVSCLLLTALVTFIGVEGQENCTYTECYQLLNSLNTTTPNSRDYCIKYNQTSDCVTNEFVQCGDVGSEHAYGILSEWIERPSCSPMDTTTSAQTPRPTPKVDCTYTKCNELYHALNVNNTSYCEELAEAYSCLDTTKDSCPDGGSLHNYNAIKTELDKMSSCTIQLKCMPCDDLYDKLVALNTSDAYYCEAYENVNKCIDYVFAFCNRNDTLFGIAFGISHLLDSLKKCNVTDIPSTTPTSSPSSCLNGAFNISVELNIDLPQFVDTNELSEYCVPTHEEEYYSCSMYSHSHFRGFNSDDLYTCSLPGLWALFSHPSLKVTALNSVPDLSGSYTFVDELNVVIPASNCSQETIYHASVINDYFPTTFEDGTSGVNGLELIFNSNGTSGYIRIPWISTTIVIHRLAGHIGVIVRSPASIANNSVGLCSLGCPEHSKLTIQEVLNQDVAGPCTQGAYIACGENNLILFDTTTEVDYYFEKCLFDILKSYNSNSSWISFAIVESWLSLESGKTNTDIVPTQVPKYENQQSAEDNDSAATSTSGSTLTARVTMATWHLSLYALFYTLLS